MAAQASTRGDVVPPVGDETCSDNDRRWVARAQAQPLYRWDGTEWGELRVCDEPAASSSLAPLRVATFNVLADSFPWFVKLAIDSPARFRALVRKVEELQPDVLGLNEVTATCLAELQSCDFIRRHYTFTHVPSTLVKPHCCIVMSRLPVRRALALSAPGIAELRPDPDDKTKQRRPPIAVQVDVGGGKLLSFCALHTIAYQTAENRLLREEQIRAVTEALRDINDAAGAQGAGFVVFGDLNLHERGEDVNVLHNDLLDAWAETHFGAAGDKADGFTFDAVTNAMIKRYIPGEQRRMRLDRILCSAGMALRPASPCRIWANEAVDASRDVFLSDHYGLVVDLEPGAFTGSDDARAVLERNAALPREKNPFSRWRFSKALVGHTVFLAHRAASDWWNARL